MPKIKSIKARQIFDSKAVPTIETLVVLEDGSSARSSVPTGEFHTAYEDVILRDDDPKKYDGKGVGNAVKNVNELITPVLVGMEGLHQTEVDKAMIGLDGTPNKSKLGANPILSVSQAVAKAAAKSSVLPLALYLRQFVPSSEKMKMPVPMFNLIEGGKHGGNSLDFQEFLIIPASSKSFSEAMEIGVSVYHALEAIIYERSQSALSAKEGGFSPDLPSNQDGFNLLREAIESSSFSFSLDLFMGLDACAGSFLHAKEYKLKDRSEPYTPTDLVAYYKSLTNDYSLTYIEDPFGQDDWEGWKKIHQDLGDKVILTGDDLTSTNPYRLQLATDNNVIGGVVLKPSQIGTVTEAIAFAEIAKIKKLKVIVSGRSGETEDKFIADFAVGVGADYVKFGAPARERNVKYNRLLEIEDDISKI